MSTASTVAHSPPHPARSSLVTKSPRSGGPFTTTAGTVRPGDQVRVEAAAASTYSTNATSVLDIDGVDIKYSVTTGPQPLQHVATTGGGGAIGGMTLLMLALLATLKVDSQI